MTSFSWFSLGDKNDPLPVQLSSFVANVVGRNVILNWTTISEINVAGFEIERRNVRGNNSEEKWEKIGYVKTNGNSSKPIEYKFTDAKLNSGTYSYRLKTIDNDGSFEYSEIAVAEIGKPQITSLEQNYPNSFNPTTRIEYQLANPSKVTIEVFNIAGEEIATLVNDNKEVGYYAVDFDANKYGLASGVYVYRMSGIDNASGAKFTQSRKMTLVK